MTDSSSSPIATSTMSTPAIIAVSVVFLSLCLCSIRIYRRSREWHKWLARDIAMTQAFHDYLARGDFDEAREIRQERRKNFDKLFNN